MITISGALLVVAVGLLVPGLLLEKPWLVYASVGVCLASAVCLVVGVFIGLSQGPARGKPAKGSTKTGARGRSAKRGDRRSAEKAAASKRRDESARSTEPAGDEQAQVIVVPGRLRYHLDSCRQVTGRETEQLSVDEARSQGYAACTSCRPDSVLAARAEASAAESADDGDEVDEEAVDEEAADEAGPGEGESGETAERDEGKRDEGKRDEDAEPDEKAAPARSSERVAAVVGQRRYHLESCQVILDAREDDAKIRELDVAQARDDGLAACTVCRAPST